MAHKPARCQAARQPGRTIQPNPNPLSALRHLIALQREHAARAGTKGRGLHSRKGSLQRLGSPPDTRTRDCRRSGREKKYGLYGLSLGPIGYHPQASFWFASAMIARPPVECSIAVCELSPHRSAFGFNAPSLTSTSCAARKASSPAGIPQ